MAEEEEASRMGQLPQLMSWRKTGRLFGALLYLCYVKQQVKLLAGRFPRDHLPATLHTANQGTTQLIM